MITFIEKFYSNANQIHEIVSKLDYKKETFGTQIKDFCLVPQGIETGFSQILNTNICLGKNSGCFRKPYDFVHFENFEPKSFFLAVIALDKTKFCTYRHKEKNYSQVIEVKEKIEDFITQNCNNKDAWDITCQVNMSPGDMVLVKPWIWHSLEGGIVNMFYLDIPVTEPADNTEAQSSQPELNQTPDQNNLVFTATEETIPTPDSCSIQETC